jgi:release factor glutamine methyltransferase
MTHESVTDQSVTGPESVTGTPAVRELLLDVAQRLGSATEARWLLEHVLGTGNGAILAQARAGTMTTPGEVDAIEALVERRLAGEPLQYVLGMWDFRALELKVDPRVLIPRPETEVVVGHALDELTLLVEQSDPEDLIVVVDLGTGSGAIALSMALEGSAIIRDRHLQIWATDDDPASLAVAGDNIQTIGEAHPEVPPVNLAEGHWFDALPLELKGRVGLVVTNPPYIAESEFLDLDPVVRDHEPRHALVSGPSGTEAIDEILNAAPEWLAPHGALVIEIAPHQAEDAALRALISGFDGVVVRRDFAERSRALVARLWGQVPQES